MLWKRAKKKRGKRLSFFFFVKVYFQMIFFFYSNWKQFQVCKIAKFEFKVTVHYGKTPSCDALIQRFCKDLGLLKLNMPIHNRCSTHRKSPLTYGKMSYHRRMSGTLCSLTLCCKARSAHPGTQAGKHVAVVWAQLEQHSVWCTWSKQKERKYWTHLNIHYNEKENKCGTSWENNGWYNQTRICKRKQLLRK